MLRPTHWPVGLFGFVDEDLSDQPVRGIGGTIEDDPLYFRIQATQDLLLYDRDEADPRDVLSPANALTILRGTLYAIVTGFAVVPTEMTLA